MEISEYLADPCRASSLPYWKAESVLIPENVTIVRDDAFSAHQYRGHDELYFKLMHDLNTVLERSLPEGYEIVPCSADGFVRQINSCYTREHLTTPELMTYKAHPGYQPELWVAVAESESGKIVATGIAELDARIGEGILEWIQVLPEYRRKGFGAFIVCELLKRMRGQARFATVSGRLNNESMPFALYERCGFFNPVIWHIVTA